LRQRTVDVVYCQPGAARADRQARAARVLSLDREQPARDRDRIASASARQLLRGEAFGENVS
jgi:hypothetical protein